MREEEKQKSVRPLKTKWYKQKRWIYPAVYLGFAAVVLAAVLWYQSDVNEEVQPDGVSEPPSAYDDQDAVPVNNTKEVFKMPVGDEGAVSIKTKFYDVNASAEEQQAALVVVNNQFFQSTGIDLVAKEEGKSFDVTASLSGKVVKAEKDPLLGYVVVLEHEDGVTTQYSSLKNVQVEKGATVKQGDVLGQAGVSEFNKEAGVHAHFEIRKDGQPINPSEYFGQVVSAIPDQMQANEQVDQESTTEQSDAEDASTEDGTETEDVSNEEEPETQETSTEPANGSSFEDDGTQNHA